MDARDGSQASRRCLRARWRRRRGRRRPRRRTRHLARDATRPRPSWMTRRCSCSSLVRARRFLRRRLRAFKSKSSSGLCMRCSARLERSKKRRAVRRRARRRSKKLKSTPLLQDVRNSSYSSAHPGRSTSPASHSSLSASLFRFLRRMHSFNNCNFWFSRHAARSMETSGSLATPGIKRPLSQYLCLKSRTNPFHKCARARTLPNKHAWRANLVRSVFEPPPCTAEKTRRSPRRHSTTSLRRCRARHHVPSHRSVSEERRVLARSKIRARQSRGVRRDDRTARRSAALIVVNTSAFCTR